AFLVQFLSQPNLHLARSLVRKCDRDNLLDGGATRREHLNDSMHQLGGLASASGCFNDQAFIERMANPLASSGILLRDPDGWGHGMALNSSSSSRSRGLRRQRSSSWGPHTMRQSQILQASRFGAAGRLPDAIA